MLSDALSHLVEGIVVYSDDVEIKESQDQRGQVFEVYVNPDDIGRVIGRKGRTATSIRTVMNAVAGHPVRVDVVDMDRRLQD